MSRWTMLFAFILGGYGSLSTSAFAAVPQLFWADQSTGSILRADLDGSNIQVVFEGEINLDPYPQGVNRLAVDEVRGILYWSDSYTNTINRISLRGGQKETIANVQSPTDLELDPTADKIYWGSGHREAGGVFRANLDGSELELLVPDVQSPGLALDLANGHLYYSEWRSTDGTGDRVNRANLDGTDSQILVAGVKDIDDLELDLTAGKIYYNNEDDGRFYRANLDGTGSEQIIDMFFESAGHGLAIQPAEGSLFWSSSGWSRGPGTLDYSFRGHIGRSNLDGTGLEILVEGGSNRGLVIATPVPEPCSLLLVGSAVVCGLVLRSRFVRTQLHGSRKHFGRRNRAK